MDNNKIEFIYWFAYYNTHSSSVIYRGKYPLEYFKKFKGINYYFVVPGYTPIRLINFLKSYLSALLFRKRNSLIVIQRVQSNFIYATLLKILIRIRNKDTIYDTDDADYLNVNPKTIYYFAEHCHKISAGSKKIAQHLSRFNNNILHITSPVFDLGIVKTYKSAIFTVGWIGEFDSEHKECLISIVFPAIKQLKFQLKFVLMGVTNKIDELFIKNYFHNYKNIIIEIPLNINWNDEIKIQKRITEFDVGIATLMNSEFQTSKSGIKAKQYMNNGVPVLSSNLPENNSVVVDGYNGYFCDTTEDFIERLNKIYFMNNSEYFKLSENARKSIENFDYNKYYRDLIRIKSIV
ncbi:MAG: glycosyltransferase [candidate division WOR-3 bacterium]